MALPVLTICGLLAVLVRFAATSPEKNDSQDNRLLMPNDQGISDNGRKGCHDWGGKLVPDGGKFIPNGNDMCMQCTCDNQFPILCQSVACSPPLQCASPQPVKGACCEYVCLNDGDSKDGNMTNIRNNHDQDEGESITNLSLRLIASTVTSFLVLALLLFMVHRLRQRRLLLAMRRFEAHSRNGQTDDTDSEQYIPDAFMSMECPPYTDPPPPYSPPKPPQILPGEQPPPYDEISLNNQTSARSADENRNDIVNMERVNTSSNPTGAAGRQCPDIEIQVSQQADMNHQLFQTGYQTCNHDGVRPPSTLPAYASTDVVEGLGVIISPGSDLVCYNPNWRIWQQGDHDQQVAGIDGDCHRHRLSSRHVSHSSGHTASSRVQTLPTTTAFQRFSNLFKRESWKAKAWRPGRPVSECNTPYYATIPRHEPNTNSPNQNVGIHRSTDSGRGENHSRTYACHFPGRMCHSYDGGHAGYTLAAISPSTSSSNSTHSSEQYDHYTVSTVATTSTSTTTSTASVTPGASSTTTSMSSPGGPCITFEDSLVPSAQHRQQFHDDLVRHLPPLQLGDGGHPLPDDLTHSTETSIKSAASSQCPGESVSVASTGSVPPSTEKGDIKDSRLPSRDSSQHSPPAGNTAPPTFPQTLNHQSLGAFIRSHPTVSMASLGESVSAKRFSADQTASQSTSSTATVGDRIMKSNLATAHSPPKQVTSIPDGHPFNRSRAGETDFLDQSFPVGSDSLVDRATPHFPTASNEPNFTSSSSSTASSPSPSFTTAATSGTMRRSQSGTSQASIFSICSETGEKKLKVGDCTETNPVISADCQYPEYHSLTRTRLSHHQEVSAGSNLSSSPIGGTLNVLNSCLESNSDPTLMKVSAECVENTVGQLVNSLTRSCENGSNLFSPVQSNSSNEDSTYDNFPPIRADQCRDDNLNLNLVPPIKAAVTKDLPWPTCDRMSQSVNIPPLPPFVTAQSGKLVTPYGLSVVPGSEETNVLQLGKLSEGDKRVKKKRGKDRSYSSPQFGLVSKARHGPASPRKHLDFSKEKTSYVKSEGMTRDKELGVRWPRSGDGKHRIQLGTNRLPLPSSSLCKQSLPRSCSDSPPLYGNADVYRGAGELVHGASFMYDPPQFLPPWTQDNLPSAIDLTIDPVSTLNDLNQPPSHVKVQVMDRLSVGHLPGVSEQADLVRLDVTSQWKKKGNHKRQASAGEKLGQVASPVRHKTRPKSLATADGYERHGASCRPVTIGGESGVRPVAAVEGGLVNKGARSGFGHDLNFDDQSGLSDFYVHDVDLIHRRAPFNSESYLNNSFSISAKKLSRVDGPIDSSHMTNKMGGTWSGGGHPSSRSGQSNELSFTNRPAIALAHTIKKRQSIPSMGGFPSGLQERSVGPGNKSRQQEGDSHPYLTHFRGERSSCLPERRLDRLGDSCGETTSYV